MKIINTQGPGEKMSKCIKKITKYFRQWSLCHNLAEICKKANIIGKKRASKNCRRITFQLLRRYYANTS